MIGENTQGISNNIMLYIKRVTVIKWGSHSVFENDCDTPDGTSCVRSCICTC